MREAANRYQVLAKFVGFIFWDKYFHKPSFQLFLVTFATEKYFNETRFGEIKLLR